MFSSTIRISVTVALLCAGIGVGALSYRTSREIAETRNNQKTTRTQLEAMRAALDELALAQRGYFEPLRTGSLAQQFQSIRRTSDALHAQVTELRSTLNGASALEGLTALETALRDFAASDARVRTNLANDTYFAAADLVVSAAAADLRAANAALTTLQDDLSAEGDRDVASLERRMRLALGLLGLCWAAGLLALVPLPRSRPVPSLGDKPEAAVLPDFSSATVEPVSVEVEPASLVDLTAAAKACGAMACVSTAAELREVLAEAAHAIGARGMIVWLGAGSQLFAVLGHGYDSRLLSRIGPLARESDNATATAWREAVLKTVPAEDVRPGAVVAPIVSVQGCIGALSVEVPPGSEADLTMQAASELFAAQLSTIVAAWPAPSAATADTETTGAPPALAL